MWNPQFYYSANDANFIVISVVLIIWIIFILLFQVSVKPFMLQSQLYSSVKDRTQVDRELEV